MRGRATFTMVTSGCPMKNDTLVVRTTNAHVSRVEVAVARETRCAYIGPATRVHEQYPPGAPGRPRQLIAGLPQYLQTKSLGSDFVVAFVPLPAVRRSGGSRKRVGGELCLPCSTGFLRAMR